MHKSNQNHVTKSAGNSSNGTIRRTIMNDEFFNKNDGNSNYFDENSKKYSTSKVSRARFAICTLGMISLAVSQMSRSVINYSITSMVDVRMLQLNQTTVSNGGSCPAPDIRPTGDQGYMGKDFNFTDKVDYENKSEIFKEQILAKATGGQDLIMDKERFMWTSEEQSLVLGGFFYSYFLFMIVGGRLAEMYGSKYVLLLAVAGSGIINLATPWMASYNFSLLVISRILMGALQSSVYPAMYALISRWLTMGEASIYTPMIKMNLRLGQVLASLVPGLILEWPNVFYVVGSIGIVWSILWLCIATSEPSTNRWVNDAELAHIMKDKKRKILRNESSGESGDITIEKEETMKRKTPWLRIITSPSVIGLIIVKLTYNFCNDFLTIELPSYLKYVHHASIQRISAITTTMFTIQVSLVLLAGWLAKIMVQKRPFGLSKTTIRKIFESAATFGSGILLLLLIFNECNLTYVTVDLQFINIMSIFVVGGEMMLPYDLSEEYPATIMAIANSVANMSGMIVTTMTGLILGDQGGSQARWNIVIALIATFDCLGGLIFCLSVKAEPIDFDLKQQQQHATEDGDKAQANNPTRVLKVN